MSEKNNIQGKSILNDGRQFRELTESERSEYGKALMAQGIKELEMYLNNNGEGKEILLRQDVNFL